MAWTKYFRPVNSVLPVRNTSKEQANGSYSRFSSWLPEIYQGAPNRLQRYTQYEQMDFDHEVHSALDIIAEFSTQADLQSSLPFIIKYDDEPSVEEVKILKSVLTQWCKLNQMRKRMFKIFRSVLKYGDQFFIRDPETFKLFWIDPSNVEKVVVNESKGKSIETYYVKNIDLNIQSLVAAIGTNIPKGGYGSADSYLPNAPAAGLNSYVSSKTGLSPASNAGTTSANETPALEVDAKHVIHLSLSDGLDSMWPFGTSELEKIFKIYKQKELIEEALLIYRVHRAPERRVFKIDVGTLPPNRAQQYIEQVKNSIQQKRIPSRTGGGESIMDSSYNPMSILEDYYFAVTADGRGSTVDTLPGGENLGQIDDVRYFSNKMLRALGIPSSYLPTGPEDGTFIYNDGKVSTAFIQEFRFQQSCKRLQAQIIEQLDEEFKRYLNKKGFNIDPSSFYISFTEPQGFSEYREIEMNAAYANVFQSVAQYDFISKRFALKKYLGWSDAEILENEVLWKEEKGDISVNDINNSDPSNIRQTGISSSDVSGFEDIPDDAEIGDLEDIDVEGGAPDLGGDLGGVPDEN